MGTLEPSTRVKLTKHAGDEEGWDPTLGSTGIVVDKDQYANLPGGLTPQEKDRNMILFDLPMDGVGGPNFRSERIPVSIGYDDDNLEVLSP